jgi:hypothetical protein
MMAVPPAAHDELAVSGPAGKWRSARSSAAAEVRLLLARNRPTNARFSRACPPQPPTAIILVPPALRTPRYRGRHADLRAEATA